MKSPGHQPAKGLLVTLRKQWVPLLGMTVVIVAALVGFGSTLANTSRSEPPPKVNAALTVTAAAAQRASWSATLDAQGSIAPWQEASIGAQVGGLRLAGVFANVGDVVKRGQLLARFDAQMLRADEAQLKASLVQAEASAAQAEANRHRALLLKGSGGISEQEILQYVTQADTANAQVGVARAQLDAKQLQLHYADILAPDDGEISARTATLGAVANSGEELFRLIRRGHLEWRGELTAMQLSRIQKGQRIALSLPDGSTAIARVRQTAPTLDTASRLGLVYADIEPGSTARAGMYAGGRIVLTQSNALVVAAASVVIRDGRSYVFKLQDGASGSRVVQQAVTVGRRQGNDVEILQGLAEGDRVAVQGAGFLDDGDVVRVVPTVRPVAMLSQASA